MWLTGRESKGGELQRLSQGHLVRTPEKTRTQCLRSLKPVFSSVAAVPSSPSWLRRKVNFPWLRLFAERSNSLSSISNFPPTNCKLVVIFKWKEGSSMLSICAYPARPWTCDSSVTMATLPTGLSGILGRAAWALWRWGCWPSRLALSVAWMPLQGQRVSVVKKALCSVFTGTFDVSC